MIIHSDFHDYYDVVAKTTGVNRELRYHRTLIELEDGPKYNHWHRSDELTIWFCGKVVRVSVIRPPQANTVYAYSLDEADECIKAHVKNKEFEHYMGRRKRHPDSLYRYNFRSRGDWYDDHGRLKAFFEGQGQGPSIAERSMPRVELFLAQLAEDYKAPIVTHHRDRNIIRINDRLDRYDFVRAIDPYTAYQEIMMFISNIALPEKPIPDVSDADMIIAKGFDPRYSFRKDPARK